MSLRTVTCVISEDLARELEALLARSKGAAEAPRTLERLARDLLIVAAIGHVPGTAASRMLEAIGCAP